jgi:hypothetical protein
MGRHRQEDQGVHDGTLSTCATRPACTSARIAAGFGCLSGAIGLLVAITNDPWGLTPHGWGIGGILLLLIALFVLVDGVVSFEKFRPSVVRKH